MKENLQRDREREKNLRKKIIFSGKVSFEKNSLFPEKILFHEIFSNFSWRIVSKRENRSIGSVTTVGRVEEVEKALEVD